MTDREMLIEIGRYVMGRNDGWRWWSPRHLTMLLDVWEPLIRADERNRMAHLARVVQGGGIPDVVAEARADQSERIAQALEVRRDAPREWANTYAFNEAVKIARSFGSRSVDDEPDHA